MIDVNTVATIALAGVGAVGTGATWAVRAYVRSQVAPVDTRLTLHETTDELIHEHIKQGFADMKADLKEIKELVSHRG